MAQVNVSVVVSISKTISVEYGKTNLGHKYNKYIFYSVFAIFCDDTLISVGTGEPRGFRYKQQQLTVVESDSQFGANECSANKCSGLVGGGVWARERTPPS